MYYQCKNDHRPIVIESYHANDCSARSALADVLSVSVQSVSVAGWRCKAGLLTLQCDRLKSVTTSRSSVLGLGLQQQSGLM